jgi:LysM repeat protein
MFVVFLFSAWRFALSKPGMMESIPASVPPVPMPSTPTQFVSTREQATTCEQVDYVVQANDTLGSIAYRFSASKKEIMIANNMKSETVISGMKVIIPACDLTPTGTVNASTITFTPILHTITSTPGG